MLKASKLTLALLINAALLPSAFASEQSEAKGFVDDASASLLLRNGYISRDKKNGAADTSSWVQSVMANVESGYTKGVVGFGVGAVGDFSFKIGDNAHHGNSMIPAHSDGSPYDQWTRGGGIVKARVSNTTVKYGTQVLDLPVLASMTTRMVPEYFTGTLINSKEFKNLELTAGKFTKNQLPDHIASDQNQLDRAVVWGAKYKPQENITAAYYGVDIKDKLNRQYINLNYKQALANERSLTYDFSAYHTKFDGGQATFGSTVAQEYDKVNNIWALSATYVTGPQSVMLAYQQNSGNAGYDYGSSGDGAQSIYLPNSYLSDFIGNDEKSLQVQYSLDFGAYNLPGLKWTTAYVYGWDIDLADTTETGKEKELFNQISYTVQSGFAKDLNVRVRNSLYRANTGYENVYMADTNEWRIFIDYPIKFF